MRFLYITSTLGNGHRVRADILTRALVGQGHASVQDISDANVVLSDFHEKSIEEAKRLGLPVVRTDQQYLVWGEHCPMSGGAKRHTLKADAYVVPTLRELPPAPSDVHFTAPPLRTAILEAVPEEGETVLVYGRVPPIQVPGVRVLNYTSGTFDEKSFIAELRKARAVIASAGFSLISECLHLKKPMLLVPWKHAEQRFNAETARSLGVGEVTERLNPRIVCGFLDRLDSFQESLAAWRPPYPDMAPTLHDVLQRFA